MKLIDKSGLKKFASALIKKIQTNPLNLKNYLNVDYIATFKKGLRIDTYLRLKNTSNSTDKRFFYQNFDGTIFRICTGTDEQATSGSAFTPLEEIFTIDFSNEGVQYNTARVARSFTPKGDGIYNSGSVDNRWKTIFAVNALNTSTKEVKENINYISNKKTKAHKAGITTIDMYDFIKDMPLASYDYKNEAGIENIDHALGFIAEDIKDTKVGKEFVFQAQDSLMYNPASYTSVLVGATKELMAKVEMLEARITELEAK